MWYLLPGTCLFDFLQWLQYWSSASLQLKSHDFLVKLFLRMLLEASLVCGRSLLAYMYPTIFYHSLGSREIWSSVVSLELSARVFAHVANGGSRAWESVCSSNRLNFLQPLTPGSAISWSKVAYGKVDNI